MSLRYIFVIQFLSTLTKGFRRDSINLSCFNMMKFHVNDRRDSETNILCYFNGLKPAYDRQISRKSVILIAPALLILPFARNPPKASAATLTTPKNPYEELQPFGESFLGKRGQNLELPRTLSADDEVPLAFEKFRQKSVAKNFNLLQFRNVDVAGFRSFTFGRSWHAKVLFCP